jgi:hypothetical protein
MNPAYRPTVFGLSEADCAVLRKTLLEKSFEPVDRGVIREDGTAYKYFAEEHKGTGRPVPVLKEMAKADLEKDATNQLGVPTGLGLVPYPLEAPAKLLYPVLTPLRNMIPRQTIGGTALYYKRVTGINTTKIWGSVPQATSSTTGRNTPIAYNEKDVTETWKTFGMESFFTPEAQRGASSTIVPGQNFNAEEFATLSCLQATMMAEEKLILGGNVTILGQVAGITKTGITQAATTVGTLVAATNYNVQVSALTLAGYYQGSVGGDVAGVLGENIPAAATVIATTAGGNAGDESLTITWTAVRGAVAYNVFLLTGGAAKYSKTVLTNYAQLLDTGTGAVANAVDQTANANDFDGLIAISEASTSGYYLALPVTATGSSTFTGDNKTGVNEIDTALKSFWDTYRLGPGLIVAQSTQRKKISEIVLGSSTPIFRVQLEAGSSTVTGGIFVNSLLNPYTGEEVPLMTHPDIPAGTVLFLTFDLGKWYPNANIVSNIEMKLAWDYQREDFARTARRTDFGVYASGGLVVRFPSAMGAITCIG